MFSSSPSVQSLTHFPGGSMLLLFSSSSVQFNSPSRWKYAFFCFCIELNSLSRWKYVLFSFFCIQFYSPSRWKYVFFPFFCVQLYSPSRWKYVFFFFCAEFYSPFRWKYVFFSFFCIVLLPFQVEVCFLLPLRQCSIQFQHSTDSDSLSACWVTLVFPH